MKTITRTFRIDGTRADEASRTVPCVISTDTPAQRRDYLEVLVHSKDAINLGRAPLPLLSMHDHQSLPVGVVEKIRLDGNKLRGVARFGSSPRAVELFRDVQEGVLRSLSVGYLIHETRQQGDSIYVTQWEPVEVSAVPIPLDSGAGFFRNFQGNNMSDQSNTENEGTNENTRTAGAERRRQTDIRNLATPMLPRHPWMEELMEKALDDESQTAETLGKRFLRKLAEMSPGPLQPDPAEAALSANTPSYGHASRADHFTRAAVDALASRMGIHTDNPAARDLADMSLRSLAITCLQRSGSGHRDLDNKALFARAMSRSDLPTLLTATGDRVLAATFEELATEHRAIVNTRHLRDFRPAATVSASLFPNLRLKREGAEITYGSITDGAEPLQLATYARGLEFTREALINDDLDGLGRAIRSAAVAAVRLERDLMFGHLVANGTMSDGYALFDNTHHHNDLTSTALDLDGLAAARKAMRLQKDTDGNPIVVRPFVLVVPAALESIAESLVAVQVMLGTGRESSAPTWMNRLSVLVDPRLDADNPSRWYLMSDPVVTPTIDLAFLADQMTPVLEEEQDFDRDVLKFKARFDVGVGICGFAGAVRCTGS